MKQKISYKKILSILSFSILLGLVYNTFSVNGINLIRTESKIDMLKSIDIIGVEDTSKSMKAITLAQALQLLENENSVFVDSRDKWDFADAHIKGAINIPQYSFEPNVTDISSLTKENIIVIYCGGDDCNMSKRLTEQFLNLGYSKTYVYLGGITEWMEAKLPTETSELK